MALFGSWRESSFHLKVLLAGVLLAHLGTYMVVPLLPIFLKVEKGMTVAQIGLILAMSPFTYQASSLLSGWLADRIGQKGVMAVGAWLNGAAIAGFALFDSLGLLISMGLLSGLGVGLNAPAIKAAIAALAAGEDQKTTAFSLRGVLANVGIALAGLLTYFVLGRAFSLIFYTATGLYVLFGFISLVMLPKGCGDRPCETVSLKSYIEIIKNKAFMVFSFVSVLIWALYTQLALSLPLRAEDILPNPNVVSLIWTVNAVIVVVLQTPISRRFIQKTHPMYVLALGVLFIGGGLGSIYFSTNFYWLMLSGAIFIIGEMLILPTIDVTVSRLGTAKMMGVFFGITNFVAGVGEGAGKFAGGQLLRLGTASFIPWLTFALAAVVISGLLVMLRFWEPLQFSRTRKSENVGRPAYASLWKWMLGKRSPAK
ncbi:MFS transporter [Bacillus sp. REN10]|uniref:MFS transporter n=1 Tax=Bacillus sp. REN10 TaxID=2782541 RepID=UPI00193BFA56|nr:MFS transporter [Bacillus sp. REN10]